ncbi:MAG TPA: queuosine precursor transporter [Candidatus Binatia bacterium]|nr:queuosine precursor transporter [Candidatus Binatia bacterium]
MTDNIRMAPAAAPQGQAYFHVVAMIFVATLLISNTIAVKVTQAGPYTLPAGILVFPISYIFGDILTECYGFARTRSVIWTGFACLAAMSAFYWLATLLPPAAFWTEQESFSRLFGFVPRIAASSFLAYLIGEFLNSSVLSKLKLLTSGRHFWLRALLSTIVGEGADSVIFNFAAFGGVFPVATVAWIAMSGFILKVAYEIIALPITYVVVAWIKRAEGIDVYDYGVRYRPFGGE